MTQCLKAMSSILYVHMFGKQVDKQIFNWRFNLLLELIVDSVVPGPTVALLVDTDVDALAFVVIINDTKF
jgi:hypothetical protein